MVYPLWQPLASCPRVKSMRRAVLLLMIFAATGCSHIIGSHSSRIDPATGMKVEASPFVAERGGWDGDVLIWVKLLCVSGREQGERCSLYVRRQAGRHYSLAEIPDRVTVVADGERMQLPVEGPVDPDHLQTMTGRGEAVETMAATITRRQIKQIAAAKDVKVYVVEATADVPDLAVVAQGF